VSKNNALILASCIVLMITGASVRPVEAQGCNGRCLFDQYGHPICSLSLYGTRICFEGQDTCAEFECWDMAIASQEASAGPQCSMRSLKPVLTGQIEVAKLKART
jgi:hypothetical protein